MTATRRSFLRTSTLAAGALLAGDGLGMPEEVKGGPAPLKAGDLPVGSAPPPVPVPHFPTRLHTFVWRNWQLAPVKKLAKVVGAPKAAIIRMAKAMGLPPQSRITLDAERRSALTVIRRNWHLLPYEQLLALLEWTPEQLAFSLREDDFLYVKLGNLKPRCEPLVYATPGREVLAREQQIAATVRDEFGGGLPQIQDPLFGFVSRLSEKRSSARASRRPLPSPRFCYSYFGLYGDPLLEDPGKMYPEGYLARLADTGVDGVWLQGVLYKLAPFPWMPELSDNYRTRLANLRSLVSIARKHGIGIYLYLNEPRAMPLRFFEKHPDVKGVTEGDHATLCTSTQAVQDYLVASVASICAAVPDLAGIFTITGSENLTNCWSHGGGLRCSRCGQRGAAEVIGELTGLFREGIRRASSSARLIVWDWGWADEWVDGIISRLPGDACLMSVSEWGIPIGHGGVETTVGEYSISVIGPGQRALRRWELARKRGLEAVAKIQAGNTWELSAVPYIPAVANVARHAANLSLAGVNRLMLGWTLGGYPSPNLEVVAQVAALDSPGQSPRSGREAGWSAEVLADKAMIEVAERRYGARLKDAVVSAWKLCGAAFSEFPFHGGLVYNAPMQFGPSNPLWAEPTGYGATMVGFPYDDLDGWRQVYPSEVFIGQFDVVADGFDQAVKQLNRAAAAVRTTLDARHRQAIDEELMVMEAASIHFRSTANQARFVVARRALAQANTSEEAHTPIASLESVLRHELSLARRLCAIQSRDSRIGFEASNQYFYVPLDLAEKAINCRDLLDRWLPAERAKRAASK